MIASDRRFALRMIPYGVHIVTALDEAGNPVAATLHWAMQTSFEPPLLAIALPRDGLAYAAIRATNRFALHMLGREDGAEALTFQGRPALVEGETLSGWGFAWAASGLPLLHDAVAVLECDLHATVEYGDHHPMIAAITAAHVRLPPQGRPDEMMLHLRELGATIFYGG